MDTTLEERKRLEKARELEQGLNGLRGQLKAIEQEAFSRVRELPYSHIRDLKRQAGRKLRQIKSTERRLNDARQMCLSLKG